MSHKLQTIIDNGLGDYRFKSLSWTESEDDIVIVFREIHNNDISDICILFTYVRCLVIDIDFGVYSGSPLLYESVFNKLSENSWSIILNFGVAPEGYISFECSDISIVGK
jgi:hypothetical protein